MKKLRTILCKADHKNLIRTNGKSILFSGPKVQDSHDLKPRRTFIEIHPGDLVLADADGGVVMNKEEAIQAISKAESIQEQEAIAFERLKNGASFNQICNIDEHIDNLEKGVSSTLRLTL